MPIIPKEPANTTWTNAQLAQMLLCLVNSRYGHLYLAGMFGHGHNVRHHDMIPLWEDNSAAKRSYGDKERVLNFSKALIDAGKMLQRQVKEQWKD